MQHNTEDARERERERPEAGLGQKWHSLGEKLHPNFAPFVKKLCICTLTGISMLLNKEINAFCMFPANCLRLKVYLPPLLNFLLMMVAPPLMLTHTSNSLTTAQPCPTPPPSPGHHTQNEANRFIRAFIKITSLIIYPWEGGAMSPSYFDLFH